MSNAFIYQQLVPNAPPYRRTEGDAFREVLFSTRTINNGFFLGKTIVPGLQEPTLIS